MDNPSFESLVNAGAFGDPPPVGGASATSATFAPSNQEWDEPIPFNVINTPDFPTESLPGPLDAFVEHLAESTQTPEEMAGTLALGVLATCFQKKFDVQITPDWKETLSLFTVAIAPPGERKSAVISALTKPIFEFEAEQRELESAEIAQNQAERSLLEKRLEAAKKAAVSPGKGKMVNLDEKRDEVMDLAAQLADFKDKYPFRLLVDDTTPEKLVDLMDMAQLAAAAGNLAIGFFNSVSETIANIDWYQIGQQVADFIANVDWNGVADSMFSAIGAALGGIAEFIAGLFNDAMANISDFFNENIEAAGGDVVAGILAGIVNGLINIGKWIGEHVFQPFIDGFKRVFGIHSPSTVMDEQGHLLMDGLKQGVTERIAAVVATFTGLWEKIKGVFSNISNWFKDKFSAAWQAVKDVFSTGGKIFDGIKDGILDGLKAVVNAIIGGINKVIAVPFNGINSALRKIRSINILGLRPFSFINTISVPQIPRLAQGAVIPPNREFMAVLGDQKSGNNIEAPEDLIRKIVREEAGVNVEMITLLRQILSATKAKQKMYVNQRVLAETARDGINNMTRTSGKSVLLY